MGADSRTHSAANRRGEIVNRELARKVADSVLYEGYMLYPYRPSALKNRQRWSFGILYPPAYPEVALGTERSSFHSECLVETTADVVIHVQLRFLHLFSRQYAAVVDGISEPVPSLFVDDQRFDSWDEPIERSVEFPVTILSTAQQHRFTFPASLNSEPMLDRQGQLAGTVIRTQREVTGIVSITTQFVRDGLIKLALDVTNTTAMPEPPANRNAALLCSLLSAHAILSSTAAQFVSLLDPPDELQNAAASLRNVGNFPVLVGFPPERDMNCGASRRPSFSWSLRMPCGKFCKDQGPRSAGTPWLGSKPLCSSKFGDVCAARGDATNSIEKTDNTVHQQRPVARGLLFILVQNPYRISTEFYMIRPETFPMSSILTRNRVY